jgi:hypothetical protein
MKTKTNIFGSATLVKISADAIGKKIMDRVQREKGYTG